MCAYNHTMMRSTNPHYLLTYLIVFLIVFVVVLNRNLWPTYQLCIGLLMTGEEVSRHTLFTLADKSGDKSDRQNIL